MIEKIKPIKRMVKKYKNQQNISVFLNEKKNARKNKQNRKN